jgi:hypothetical protein
MKDLTVDQWINVASSLLATTVCAVFIATYTLKAPWWISRIGRNLVGFAAAVGLFCLYTVLVSLWPDGCFAVVMRGVRTAAVLAISALMVQRTRLLLQAQREQPPGD